MNRLKDFVARKRIPKDTPYCYTPKKAIKPCKKYPYGGFKTKVCPYFKMKYCKEYHCLLEYCTYIKSFLSVQDQVKDCGVNDDY